MIFDGKPMYYMGLLVLYSENMTLKFSVVGVTLPSGSEALGTCYLRLVVGKMLVTDENLARIQLE